MQIQPCAFDGSLHIGAPKVCQLRGLDASNRDIARHQVRQALQSCLADELGCALSELELTNVRGQPVQVIRNGLLLSSLHCSISHAPALALLAWRWNGPVGVDVQAVEAGATVPELLATAQLYLDRKIREALALYRYDAHFFEVFAQAWVLQEARLKCAGLGLVEWSEALDAQLQGMHYAPLVLDKNLKAAVAWR
jgi:4'-phosphopantetheinyl transferase